ncbi:MAG: hypothetical protein ABMA64_40530 [Myxococcota bacterium]
MWWFTAAAAWADGARSPIEPVSVELGDARAMVVRGVVGQVELVGAEVDAVSATGSAVAPVEVKLTRKDGVVYARVKGAEQAGLELTLTVPRSLAALTVQDQRGALSVSELPTRFAVVTSEGAVTVRGTDSVRVSHLAGALRLDEVRGDVFVDALDGPLSVKGIGGDVALTEVSGAIQADDIGGDLSVEGTASAVTQSGVRGTVHLP